MWRDKMPRVNADDVSLFSPNAKAPNTPEKISERIVYTLKGDNVSSKDEYNAYAYEEDGKHFIKLNNRHELFNPLDLNHINSVFAVEKRKEKWNWKKIPESAFEAYLTFLDTHNASFLNIARREIVSEVL